VQDAGRAAAAIAILEDFERRRVPLKTAIADWARGARYAGSKDRAWISGLLLDILRRRQSLAAVMAADDARAAALAALRFLWDRSADDVRALAAAEPHGPGALSATEEARLLEASLPLADDYPSWLGEKVRRAFGADAASEMAAFGERADIDLRLNTLRTTPEKALAALGAVGARAHDFVQTAARIPAPDSFERAPAVTVIPAFNKGYVEVQDVGSQIAALAAGDVTGAQVFDYCAGGGGKTLALASLMNNRGQLYAYDSDARRLAPLYDRAKRAGVRNLQIVNPVTDDDQLATLRSRMDVAFVDAPCTGSGTWRRKPDTKWRLTPQQLQARQEEQDRALAEASSFVKPGGRLVYVTCSFLKEENEDRLAAFLGADAAFRVRPALAEIAASGLIAPEGAEILKRCATPEGYLRLSPRRTRTDGFFIAVLEKTG